MGQLGYGDSHVCGVEITLAPLLVTAPCLTGGVRQIQPVTTEVWCPGWLMLLLSSLG